MSPAILQPSSDEKCFEKDLQRQIGCMTGFLQLFDRQQRIYAPKRINSGSSSSSDRSEYSAFPSSPDLPPPPPPPVFDAWKLKDGPRLSLDSRLRPREQRTVQIPSPRSDDKIQRPTSVVAKLMGLDNLPPPSVLRRSASESRVSRVAYQFVEDIVLHKPPDLAPVTRSKPLPPPMRTLDFFPDPNRVGSRIATTRPAKDMETLKLILEASQLKGLLHSRNPPIVVLKPDPRPKRRPEPVKKTRTPPKPAPRKVSPSSAVRSPRKKKPTAEITPPPPLLRRCDELLKSIAAFTEQVNEQPSPVSVLDSSFLGEECVASPAAKRSIVEWTHEIPAVGFHVSESDREEFGYVYDILRLSEHYDSFADVYSLLEKRYSESACRRVVFDAVAEIVVRKRHVSSWEAFSGSCLLLGADQLIREVWLEVRRLGELNSAGAEDLNEVTCRAIRKDLGGGDHGWGDTSAEMCDAVVLQIERLLFKDLVADAIKDLADVARGRNLFPRRRKLVF